MEEPHVHIPKSGKAPIKSREFSATDEDLEIMADEALGPEPDEYGDEALYDETPQQAHERLIKERLAAAKLAWVPSVRDVMSERRKRRFIVALAETGVIANACARAGWSRSMAAAVRKSDPDFSQAWDDALEMAADAAEAEAFRRGVYGAEKDVYFKGEVVGKEVIYSDRLLELTLKARRPDRFRDHHKVETEVKGGVLVLPAAPSEGDWEAGAAAGQAQYRENPEN